jgi:hypothetical protein
MSKLPQELIDIRNFLSNYDFTLSHTSSDWRIESAINEWEITNILSKNFNILLPRDRERYDFAIQSWNRFYPVNIKVSDTTHNDNLNCKLWIYYALTWKLPNFPNETSRENFLTKLKQDLQDNDADYYFLVVNKKNLSDIILTSLKWLESLVPNWNNLPFQCQWNNNRRFIVRDFSEIKSFILTTFWDSIQKRASVFLLFDKLFHEYVR